MSKPFVHYAWHLSYFSGKTRSYLLYKDIPFVEKVINMYTFSVQAKNKTGAAVMPIVVTPEGEWLQDTSVIIDRLEQRFPKAPVVPNTPVQKVASYLVEMWGDEWWLVVAMYTRWWYPENLPLFLKDAGKGLLPWFPWFLQKRAGAKAAGMMRGHREGLGIIAEQVPLLDRWTRDMLDLLDAHFAQHPFLFGDKPSIGDFGLIGPMYAHLGRDPWSKRELIDPRRNLRNWVTRMTRPKSRSGAFLANDEIPQTLSPIFRAMFREFIPLLEQTNREAIKAMAVLPAGKPLPRGLGVIEFPMGDGRYRRAALPYVLWMAQRIQDVYRSMSPSEQVAVRVWMTGLGGEAFLDLSIPKLRRYGLRVGPELAAA
jgi:glutathione S-transferase